MIFQNRRLILARKIVIEWRFHVLSFCIFRLNFNQIIFVPSSHNLKRVVSNKKIVFIGFNYQLVFALN